MKIDFFNSHNKKKKLAHLFVSQLTSKNKYEKFKLIETSYFLNRSDKRLFYRFYQKNIRVYLLFIKLLSRKRETLRCFDYDFDLSLNHLLQSRTIKLFHCNMLYKFDIFDILKIIKNALHYNNDLFIESQYPKNPYNNEEFSLGNLMNIFFYMKRRGMNIPSYFEAFRRCGFQLQKYIEENEPMIKLKCIENYCNDMTDTQLYGEIIIMLRSYNLKKAVIHPIFPRQYVIHQFKSYIKNYYIQCYGNHPSLQIRYKTENKRAIQEFFDKNVSFGRIIITSNISSNATALEAQYKYKFTNYLSRNIPNYNFFEDIEKYNLREEPYDEDSESDDDIYGTDNELVEPDLVGSEIVEPDLVGSQPVGSEHLGIEITNFLNFINSNPPSNTHIRYLFDDDQEANEEVHPNDEESDEETDLDILLSDPVVLRDIDNQILQANQDNQSQQSQQSQQNGNIYQL